MALITRLMSKKCLIKKITIYISPQKKKIPISPPHTHFKFKYLFQIFHIIIIIHRFNKKKHFFCLYFTYDISPKILYCCYERYYKKYNAVEFCYTESYKKRKIFFFSIVLEDTPKKKTKESKEQYNRY